MGKVIVSFEFDSVEEFDAWNEGEEKGEKKTRKKKTDTAPVVNLTAVTPSPTGLSLLPAGDGELPGLGAQSNSLDSMFGTAAAVVVLTEDNLRDKAVPIAKKGAAQQNAVLALLDSYGAKSLGQLPKDKYNEFSLKLDAIK